MPGMPGMENGYDMAAQKDKEGFFSRSSRDDSWILPHARTAGQRYELKTERVIPAAMITGINSDLPGQIQAQVTQDVYDSATGDHLLIPKGAKLTGSYDSRVIFGQRRVLVAWTRVIYPDGSALSLGAMPGADIGGYAGFADKVNNHYLKIFGNAFHTVLHVLNAGEVAAVGHFIKEHQLYVSAFAPVIFLPRIGNRQSIERDERIKQILQILHHVIGTQFHETCFSAFSVVYLHVIRAKRFDIRRKIS